MVSVLNMVGGVCMLLFGMKTMSEGLQKSAGERMRKALNFVTGNRFAGVFTGFMVTSIVQSSTAVSVLIVSFVNIGLLSLTQSVGVLFGTNIGTTLTAWIISIVGFRISMSGLALPAIGIGFVLCVIRWRYKDAGVGLVMTVIINSSTASVALIMALAFQGIVAYEMAAGMILGAQNGGAKDPRRRA